MSNDGTGNAKIKKASARKLSASSAMCYCCFDTLIDGLQQSNQRKNSGNNRTQNPDFVEELANPSVQCPLFVTWEKCSRNESIWQLRGCIGCLSPRPLATDVSEYALISALNDRRFNPIALEEIPSLRVAVSLLVDYEVCEDVYDWTIGVHGILIKFVVNGQRFDGTFLPEVAKEQRWDHAQTLSSLIRKAGYNGAISTELLKAVKCTRYQSSKCKVTYGEYVNAKYKGVDPLRNQLENKRSQSRSWWPYKNK
eukprot:CAMPEP_0116118358 /NCGR_PEP_ID=MMETSP0329-20121206/2060_1 /TAXON_ID=697910 /ORGANISM="Pseudo-nitzschia arenysensis, Strain B593" /LENGTH=252 /DNA_ID=CAMNT_0003611977 /DNA_START=82 /DNA_END=840 /DNA_ORIENTATION=-